MQKFDIGGLAALVCRHDVPLFIANVDTPGEQQKYAVSLIEHMFKLLPPKATVVVLYDVGCVLDRSVAQYEMFVDGIEERVMFATSVMHSYVHQWSCQLHYNPRLKDGLGLTDGENVERLWSRSRGLIPVCRSSGKHRRVWLINRKLRTIAKELKEEMGSWISRKLNKGVVEQTAESQKTLDECNMEVKFLEKQWADQKATQISVRSPRLKTHLGNILNIQTDINELEATVEKSLGLLKKGLLPETCRPAIVGVDLEFVQKLYLVREIKANVQRKATSTFWEFDKLDRAAGGKDIALGTKMHQHVRSAMTKKTAALTAAIKRYNTECQSLAAVSKPEWNIPLPEPLPTNMGELKTCTTLMENVWIEPIQGDSQRWVHDQDVRDGIRAMLRLKRCREEHQRLGREADNMLKWYRKELKAIATAIKDSSNVLLVSQLRLEFEELAGLKSSWATSLITEASYEAHLSCIVQAADGIQLTWAPVKVADDSIDDSELSAPVLHVDAGEEDSSMLPSAEEVCLNDLFSEQAEHEGKVALQPLSCNLTWQTPVSFALFF
ncbi:hypothetical protein EST38_g13277 [Candolleomyces aberdarensis]|uniref:Uncharacterized protein n=1 Tax=Candolleomyces aberdarensis TaxID=2316362 RepID=A0A4V1Q1S2_9AGAR|nr:hypothetical protein EST38_g13277 [Candolleomyces aberdarensis]